MPSTACTTCSCTAGSRSSRPRNSGRACQAVWQSGAAAAGVVVLGKQFSSRTVALSAGVICAILPRATWAGIEARPYALSMMVAAWSTVLLVHAARRDNAWVWLWYGAAMAAVDSARRLPRADVLGARRIPVFLPAPAEASSRGSASPRFARALPWRRSCGWPSVRRIRSSGSHRSAAGRSKTSPFSSTSKEVRCFLIVSAFVMVTAVILWRFTSAQLAEPDRHLLTLAIAWLVRAHRVDPRLLGGGPSDIHASLPVFHRTGDGTRAGRLRGRVGGPAVDGRSRAGRFRCLPQRRIIYWCNAVRTRSTGWTTARSPT